LVERKGVDVLCEALEGILQTRSRGIIGAKIVHVARASQRTMSRLIAP
jgi:hypothetical protein